MQITASAIYKRTVRKTGDSPEAANHSGHDPDPDPDPDPDRVSFVAALRITRQTLAHPGAFPP